MDYRHSAGVEERLRDRVLGKYKPLPSLVAVDDFDEGPCGWVGWTRGDDPSPAADTGVPPRFEGTCSVPQVSSLPMWDVGTYGSLNSFALKVPSLPYADSTGRAFRPVSISGATRVRIESYFTYAADPSDFHWGETDIGDFEFALHIADPSSVQATGRQPRRVKFAARYRNADTEGLVQRWQIAASGGDGVAPDAWDDVADGEQKLGFNRSPTKFQWHYFRLTVDPAEHRYVDLNCYGKEFSVENVVHRFAEESPENIGVHGPRPGECTVSAAVRTVTGKRCYLYLDSVVVSATPA